MDDAAGLVSAAEAAKVYARNVLRSQEAANHAAHVSMLCQRRAGELLAQTPKHPGGQPSKNHSHDESGSVPRLEDLGVNHNQSSRWQKLAAIPEDRFEEAVSGITGAGDELTTAGVLRRVNGAHVGHNSGEPEWFTPGFIVDAARGAMGGIDLDPASTPEANEVVGAARFYTVDDDGLSRPWEGRVWVNPPYGQPTMTRFCERAVAEHRDGNATAVCVITNNATETAWWQHLATAASAVCFLTGRVRFWYPERPSFAPLQGQTVVYLGATPDAFGAAFSALGLVLRA